MGTSGKVVVEIMIVVSQIGIAHALTGVHLI